MKMSLVYILILNWNGWKDTIECLESVFRLDYENYRVIVCDNDSSDGSLDYIKDWAERRLDLYLSQDSPLRHLSFPPVSKVIPYRQYDRKEAEAGGDDDDGGIPLILIQTGSNLGFAGGNNVGLRYALVRNDFDYVWLLNNDTVVEPLALKQLVNTSKSSLKNLGIIGSKLLYYDNPTLIQTVGGKYNKFFGTTKHIGMSEFDHGQYDNDLFIKTTDYVIGASMFAKKDFLLNVGLMCEDYFLYYEELDWVLRGNKLAYDLGYTWQSRVYHKEGRKVGSSSEPSKKSELSDYFGLRNRVLFARKYFLTYLLTVYLGFIVVAFNRIIRGQFGRLKLIWKAFRNVSIDHI